MIEWYSYSKLIFRFFVNKKNITKEWMVWPLTLRFQKYLTAWKACQVMNKIAYKKCWPPVGHKLRPLKPLNISILIVIHRIDMLYICMHSLTFKSSRRNIPYFCSNDPTFVRFLVQLLYSCEWKRFWVIRYRIEFSDTKIT